MTRDYFPANKDTGSYCSVDSSSELDDTIIIMSYHNSPPLAIAAGTSANDVAAKRSNASTQLRKIRIIPMLTLFR